MRARPALINLLACLGRGLERGEEGKKVVEGKEREETEGQEASEAGPGRSQAGFKIPFCFHALLSPNTWFIYIEGNWKQSK